MCRMGSFIPVRGKPNGFIFFGKAGEMASNRQKDLELSMLCLRLLQKA